MEAMYYIGLDVHKRKISYCVKDGSGKIHAEGSIHYHQIPPLAIQSSVQEIFQQPFNHRGVLRGSLPHSQHVLFSAFRDPQRYHQHLATKVNAIDHQHHQMQIF